MEFFNTISRKQSFTDCNAAALGGVLSEITA